MSKSTAAGKTTVSVQLLADLHGAASGWQGEIVPNVPAAQACHLARGGLVVILGDEPGDTIDPDDLAAELGLDLDAACEQLGLDAVMPPADTPAVETNAETGNGSESGETEPDTRPRGGQASGAALKLAQAAGIDIADVPNGGDGKVSKPDVQAYIKELAERKAAKGE